MRRLFFHEESIHEVSRRYLDAPYEHTHTRAHIRTSRNQYVPHFFKVGGITKHYGRMHGRTHTVIVVHTCGSCNTVLTLNTCFTGTVESIGGYIIEQSVSVRSVQELIVREAGR